MEVRGGMKHESGFTLIEMLATMTLAGLLMVLSVGALRSYWLTQSVESGANEVVAQLRQLQARVTSESHPLVYGVRFPIDGGSTFGLVRYNPAGSGLCTQYGTGTTSGAFSPGGARVRFPDTSYSSTTPAGFGFDVVPPTATCRTEGLLTPQGTTVSVPPVSNLDQYVWFYAKGTATAGRLQIMTPTRPTRTITVTVRGLTGRVERSS